MYTAYFGLNETPFSIAPDPLYLFMSETHRDALAHLQYGIKTDGGFVLLTGEVGAGKTTLCRSLLEQLPDNVDVAFVLNPKLTVIELLETICDELSIDYPAHGSVKQLVDRINAYLLDSNASGRKTVLIIDEAQNLPVDVLEQLRLLTNLETNRYKLLQIVLLGQPELLQILNRQEMRQLSQRVTARFHLGPLEPDEIGSYIEHRLKVAGCERPVFADTLYRQIWKLSSGLPRLINLICDRALLGAYARGIQAVDEKILRQAASEVLGNPQPEIPSWKNPQRLLLAGALLFVLFLAAWFWPESLLPPPLQSETAQVAVSKPDNDPPEKESSAAEDKAAVTSSLPESLMTAHDKEEVFRDLAGLWGLPEKSLRADYCSVAREQGLECLARQDSLDTLRRMNRPAMLTLYGDDGIPFYVVLAGLQEDRVTFVYGSQQMEIALSAITTRWYGNYLLLWSPPPIDRYIVKPGGSGAAVAWLALSLEELGFYQSTGQENRLEGELLGAFKEFQFRSGLTPDGVLGPMSIIQLNTARNLGGPRLYSQGAS